MSNNKSQFWSGARDNLPVVIAAAPFSLLFGTLAVENGLSVAEATWMSLLVFAGASQMVGVELFGQNIPAWLIVFSIFAVNFRHVLYSATLGRFLTHLSPLQQGIAFFLMTDPQFALSEQKGQSGEKVTMSWYLGLGLSLYIPWIILTWIGAMFGRLIPMPEQLGITFILYVYFLALLMTFRKRSRFVPVVGASAISSAIAYTYIGTPWHLTIGALCGMFVAFCWPVQINEEAA